MDKFAQKIIFHVFFYLDFENETFMPNLRPEPSAEKLKTFGCRSRSQIFKNFGLRPNAWAFGRMLGPSVYPWDVAQSSQPIDFGLFLCNKNVINLAFLCRLVSLILAFLRKIDTLTRCNQQSRFYYKKRAGNKQLPYGML